MIINETIYKMYAEMVEANRRMLKLIDKEIEKINKTSQNALKSKNKVFQEEKDNG